MCFVCKVDAKYTVKCVKCTPDIVCDQYIMPTSLRDITFLIDSKIQLPHGDNFKSVHFTGTNVSLERSYCIPSKY